MYTIEVDVIHEYPYGRTVKCIVSPEDKRFYIDTNYDLIRIVEELNRLYHRLKDLDR